MFQFEKKAFFHNLCDKCETKRKFKATGNVNAVLLDYGIPDGTNKMF
jgi:hypothetical protein